MTTPLKVALVALNSPGYRSLALGYLRAYAEARDDLRGRVSFQTLDLDTGHDPWWVAYRLLALEPDVVGFSVTCWNARAVHEACRVVKAARPEALIVLGGPEVGPIAEEVLASHPAVGAVVRGEGEETFAELLYAVTRGRRVSLVDGVTARSGDEVVSAPGRPLIADLDSIPSPYLSGVLEPVDGATFLETYRGCPHRCSYCFEGKGYGRVRAFSDERVRAEIDLVAGAPGMRSFSFIDPVFNLSGERLALAVEWLAPYAASGVRLHTVEVDIERIGPEQAALLARAGVASVETGPQSVGAAALAACERPFDPVAFRAGIEALRAEGISAECDLIIGLPGDTVADFVDGLEFVVSTGPGRLQCSTLHVLPGTGLWERSSELGVEFDREPPHEVVATPGMSFADLRRAEVMGMALSEEYAARL